MADDVEAGKNVEQYLNVVSRYEKYFKKWETRADKILKKYRDDSESAQRSETAKFNILWANVQTLKSATFSRLPQPDVSRRFADNDPVARVASLVIERALEYEIQHYSDYRAAVRSAVYDRFLGGRGTAWCRYEPHTKKMPSGLEVDDDAEVEEPEQFEELDYECAPTDYVHYKDFGHNVARTWEEVVQVWRKVYMTRAALDERFGDKGKLVPLDSEPEDLKNKTSDKQEGTDKLGLVIELWDKETMQAVWIGKSSGEILDCKDDPLGLDDFFPCPRPLFSTLTPDSLVPIPDYSFYQDQANELNVLADRIDGLTKALKVSGVYDASITELKRLFSEAGNNELVPVKDWSAFAEKQGLKGAIDMVDLTPIVAALQAAMQTVSQIKEAIYELTGIADILRGASDPNETLGAQEIKQTYANMRIKTYQDEVTQFATSLMRRKAHIICTKFQPQTLFKMAACDQFSDEDKEILPQAYQLLSSNPLRSFRIEISTDSMVYSNEQQDKQDRMEFATTVSAAMEKLAGAPPPVQKIGLQLLKWVTTGFRVGKNIEGEFDAALDALEKQASQPQPNPELQKTQMEGQVKMQIAGQQAQIDAQTEQARAQADAASAQAQAQAKAQADMAIEAAKQQGDQKMEQMRFQHENAMKQMQSHIDGQFQTLLAAMNNKAKIEVAEIAAQTAIDTQQIAAAQQASQPDAP